MSCFVVSKRDIDAIVTRAFELYQDAGRKAAIALNNRDWACSKFHSDHMRRMLALETIPNRQIARAAYDAAYSAVRHQYITR